MRGAPRDALVADITPPQLRGAAFGLRQSLDTVGAFVGPLLATGLMLLWADDFRAVFWVAVIPGLLAVALLLVSASGSPSGRHRSKRGNPIRRDNLRRLGGAYWWVVGVGGLFTLARFSEAFLVLRAQQIGIALALVPLVMVAMNIVYALAAYPFGKLSDRVSHARLLAIGLVVLIAADLVLAASSHWSTLLAGVALWGIHLGITQGLLATMVADTAPADLRGTAFGFFNLVERHCHAARQPVCRAAVGFAWRGIHLLRRCGIQPGGARRPASSPGRFPGFAGGMIGLLQEIHRP